MIDLAAVILVGGKSSRMGRDKATLPYQGKRLVDVVAETARAAGIPRIYVSGMLDGYTSIPDLVSGRGPASGICTCALRLSGNHERLLFLPVDMPHLSPELLQTLLGAEPGASCYFENHPLPCILPLSKENMRHIDAATRTLANKQELSVKSLLEALGAKAIAVQEHLKRALTNTNTPEQWREAMHESAH